jgi:hypothetical protein
MDIFEITVCAKEGRGILCVYVGIMKCTNLQKGRDAMETVQDYPQSRIETLLVFCFH